MINVDIFHRFHYGLYMDKIATVFEVYCFGGWDTRRIVATNDSKKAAELLGVSESHLNKDGTILDSLSEGYKRAMKNPEIVFERNEIKRTWKKVK